MGFFNKIKGKTLITGFHGIGLVGFIAVDYLVRKLKAKRIGWFFEDFIPSIAFFGEKGLEMPVEFYIHKNIVFMKVNVLMEKDDTKKFFAEIFARLKANAPKEIIVLGGLSTAETEVFGIGNSLTKKILAELKVKVFPKEITIFGPMAEVLIHSENCGIPAVCVLPNASAAVPDPNAASRAIKTLSKKFGFRVSVEELEKEARKIEERLKEMGEKDELSERMFV
jgi:uncharacterized protein